jgi:hypothetical protein
LAIAKKVGINYKIPAPERLVRQQGVAVISILGQKAAPSVPDIYQIAQNPDLSLDAALSLSWIGARGESALIALATNRNPIVRNSAFMGLQATFLSNRNTSDGFLAMIKMVSDPDDEVNKGARIWVRERASLTDEFSGRIYSLLSDPDPAIRNAATNVIIIIGRR